MDWFELVMVAVATFGGIVVLVGKGHVLRVLTAKVVLFVVFSNVGSIVDETFVIFLALFVGKLEPEIILELFRARWLGLSFGVVTGATTFRELDFSRRFC